MKSELEAALRLLKKWKMRWRCAVGASLMIQEEKLNIDACGERETDLLELWSPWRCAISSFSHLKCTGRIHIYSMESRCSHSDSIVLFLFHLSLPPIHSFHRTIHPWRQQWDVKDPYNDSHST